MDYETDRLLTHLLTDFILFAIVVEVVEVVVPAFDRAAPKTSGVLYWTLRIFPTLLFAIGFGLFLHLTIMAYKLLKRPKDKKKGDTHA